MLEQIHAQQGGFGPGGPPPGGYPPGPPGAPPGGPGGAPPGGPGAYGPPPGGAPPGGLPPGQPQQFGQPGQPGYSATPGKQGKGFKYAIIGCGCLALLVAAVFGLFFFGGAATYFGLRSATAPGGAVCEQAIKCCKVISSGNTAAAQACDNLKGAPKISCEQALKGYKTSAKTMGKTCP